MILLDANPLIALVDDEDELHAAARRDLQGLPTGRLFLPISALAEACFGLPLPHERLGLRDLLHGLHIQFITDEGELVNDVMDWLLKYAEHGPDWTDGCLAVLSARHPRWKVWTYDSEFWTTWRRPDGSRIPLAVRPSR